MTNAAQKTPISLLQELCAQFGMTPDYKLMSVEGAVHAPTFMYRVQVSEVAVTATGQSKKKAKHAAAKAVLEKLLSAEGEYSKGFVSDGVTVNSETLAEIISEQTSVPTVEDNTAVNPVGALQEMCMKKRWQPPYYETERATGLPHEKIFYIACYVDKFREIGEGKSKRLAKREAADNMYNRLKELDQPNDDDNEEDAKDTCKNDEDGDEIPDDSNSAGVEIDDNSTKKKWEEVLQALNLNKAASDSDSDENTQKCDTNIKNIEVVHVDEIEKTIAFIKVNESIELIENNKSEENEPIKADPAFQGSETGFDTCNEQNGHLESLEQNSCAIAENDSNDKGISEVDSGNPFKALKNFSLFNAGLGAES